MQSLTRQCLTMPKIRFSMTVNRFQCKALPTAVLYLLKIIELLFTHCLASLVYSRVFVGDRLCQVF